MSITFDYQDWLAMGGSSTIRSGQPFTKPTRAAYAARAKWKAEQGAVAKAAPGSARMSAKAASSKTAMPLRTAAEVLALLDASDAKVARRDRKAAAGADPVLAAWEAAGRPYCAAEAERGWNPPALVREWLQRGLVFP